MGVRGFIDDSTTGGEEAWRKAILEVEQARHAYAAGLRSGFSDERAIGKLWLRLWRAERCRDELMKQSA